VPLTDHIQRSHLFGDVDGIVQRQQQHGGPHAHTPGFSRQARQRRQRLDFLKGGGEIVLSHHDQVKARVARRPHLFDMLAKALDHRHTGRMLFRYDQAKFHETLQRR
jgi:hypothetical protein